MDSYDLDFDRIEDGRLCLSVFRWICRRPFVDPMGLNDAQVVARTQHEAMDYLLDQGGWRNRTAIGQEIGHSYDVVVESVAPPFNGTWREWTQAVHHGIYPRELVRLPEGAQTQELIDARTRRVEPKGPKVNQGILNRVEAFLERQSHYCRFWRGVRWVLLGLTGIVIVYFIWQLLVSLATGYILVRAFVAGIRNS